MEQPNEKQHGHSTFSPFPFFFFFYFRGGGGSAADGGVKSERAQDQKEKMLAELQVLWKEQCDHLRKKKEQFATEVRRTGTSTRMCNRFICNAR